ncbi:MAG: hypothetical protein ACOY4Q_06020 [Bacillota bacterium]
MENRKEVNQLQRSANKLPAFKKENPEYKEVHSQVLQDALRRVDTAYKNFFAGRAGYPRFKGKDRCTSITYPQVDKVSGVFSRLDQGFIYLSKIGYVKIRMHRNFDFSTARRVNIKLRGNAWYAKAKYFLKYRPMGLPRPVSAEPTSPKT